MISLLASSRTRSISAENTDGAKGGGAKEEPSPGNAASMLGKGWKVRLAISLAAGKTVTLADSIKGRGHYVGTFLAWTQLSNGWWGEGEIKFYMDGDIGLERGQVRDISGWIHNGMWAYCPEYPGAEITELPHPAFLLLDYPVYLQKFVIGGQTGTHIETRAHVDKAAEPVTALPLGDFYRPPVVNKNSYYMGFEREIGSLPLRWAATVSTAELLIKHGALKR